MSRIKIIGLIYLILSAVVIASYGILLWIFPQAVLKISAFILVSAIFGLIGWVGLVMLTAPGAGGKNE